MSPSKTVTRVVGDRREKRCTACGEWKDTREFYRNRGRGLCTSRCKICHNACQQNAKDLMTRVRAWLKERPVK